MWPRPARRTGVRCNTALSVGTGHSQFKGAGGAARCRAFAQPVRGPGSHPQHLKSQRWSTDSTDGTDFYAEGSQWGCSSEGFVHAVRKKQNQQSMQASKPRKGKAGLLGRTWAAECRAHGRGAQTDSSEPPGPRLRAPEAPKERESASLPRAAGVHTAGPRPGPWTPGTCAWSTVPALRDSVCSKWTARYHRETSQRSL